MKKALNTVKILAIAFILLISTGCAKYNTTMDIKANKSMTITTVYAVDASLLGESEQLVDEAEKKKLEDKGYKVEEYSEGSMKGYKISIDVLNIDLVSDTGDVTYNLAGILEDESKVPKIFSVEKGLFKNKYKAKLAFNYEMPDMGDDFLGGEEDNQDVEGEGESQVSPEGDEDNSSDEILQRDEDEVGNEGENSDSLDSPITDDDLLNEDGLDFDKLVNLMSTADLSFTVKLPSAAISNNATKTENDGKTLIWTLTAVGDSSSIDFEFELYNYLYIGLLGGAIILLVVLAIVIILRSKKKKGKGGLEVAANAQTQQAFTTEQAVVPVEVPQATATAVPTSTDVPVAQNPVGAPAPVVQTPAAPAPVAQAPVAQAPVAPAPVIVEPVASAPVTPTSVGSEPVILEPAAPTSVTPAPVVLEPVAPAPVVVDPIAPEPVAPAPVIPEPATTPAPVASVPAISAADVATEVIPATIQPVQVNAFAGSPIQPVEVAPAVEPVVSATDVATEVIPAVVQPVQVDALAGSPMQPVEVVSQQVENPVNGQI